MSKVNSTEGVVFGRVPEIEIEKRKFLYIDAMPGAGKTEFFVEQGVNLLMEDKPSRNILYVAPTVHLLGEALNRLRKHKNFSKKFAKRIILLASIDKVEPFKDKCVTYKGGPVQCINELLALVDNPEPECRPLDKGYIVLITHECFVQVSPRDMTGGNFKVLKSTSVIFDEARHCVIDTRTTRDLTYGDLSIMSRLFKFNRKTPSGQHLVGAGWFTYEVTCAPSRKRLLEGFNTTRISQVPKAVQRLGADVKRYSDNGRAKIYFMTNMSNAHTFLDEDERNAVAIVTTLLRPTSLFNNYLDVTLTSAFFKDSQMYHFLKQDGHTFRNLAKSSPSTVSSIIKRDKLLRKVLPERLLVAHLMAPPESGRTNKYRNTLTAWLLEQGIVVPRSLTPAKVQPTLNKTYTSVQLMDALCRGYGVSRDKKIQNQLTQFAIPPLWVLINECSYIIKNTRAQNLIPSPSRNKSVDSDCLLLFNVKSRMWRGQVPASDAVRTLYANGTVTKGLDLTNESHRLRFEGALDKHAVYDTLPEVWEKRLAKHLYVRSPDSMFVAAPSTKLHGLNRYSKLNAFAHLAALNPSPPMVALYSALLGSGYDVDLDHSVENLVQMLYRTSLRNPSATDKVLMIVPYAAYSDLLQQKVGCGDFTVVHEPRLMPWNYSKPIDTARRREIASLGGKRTAEIRSLGLSPKAMKARKSLVAMRSKYSKYLKDSPKDARAPHWKAKLRDLNEQIDAMVTRNTGL